MVIESTSTAVSTLRSRDGGREGVRATVSLSERAGAFRLVVRDVLVAHPAGADNVRGTCCSRC